MKQDYIVKSVTTYESGNLSVSTTEGTGFGLDSKYGVTPEPGDVITLYMVQGNTIRGMDINGTFIYYKTDEYLKQERKEWLENYRLEKLASFEKDKARLDTDFANLPLAFQSRITRFREASDDFRVDSESYEMFCCMEAVKIANTLKTPDAVKNFKELPYEAQIKLVSIDGGHSGNTFGGACMLAYRYLEGKEL
jgi:hypothetical protein